MKNPKKEKETAWWREGAEAVTGGMSFEGMMISAMGTAVVVALAGLLLSEISNWVVEFGSVFHP
jgi:hypothetical protein